MKTFAAWFGALCGWLMARQLQPAIKALASPEPLWMTAAEIAEITAIDARSVRRRLAKAVPALLAHDLYVREAASPRGGGLRGRMKQFALSRIARDFPGAISEEELSRARELAARRQA